MSTRIEFLDMSKVPATKINYPGPFKQIRYEVLNTGMIRFTIVKELNLHTYDVNFAKSISQLREVQINVYETMGGTEYLIRSLKANFSTYVLDERPMADGSINREEILNWEITKIL